MKTLFFYISICLLVGCEASKKTANFNQLIVGEWEELQPTYYPKIEFYEKDAVFYTTGDTILSYSYIIDKHDLILTDRNNKRIHNEIIKLTKDSLSFKSLLEGKTLSGYLKNK